MTTIAEMPDGNTAALRKYEADQYRRDSLLDRAESRRKELVEDFFNDEQAKNDDKLQETLADLVAGDSEFLHALQRGDLPRMRKLMVDAVDAAYGDEIVDKYAQALEEDRPCRCRGDCTC